MQFWNNHEAIGRNSLLLSPKPRLISMFERQGLFTVKKADSTPWRQKPESAGWPDQAAARAMSNVSA